MKKELLWDVVRCVLKGLLKEMKVQTVLVSCGGDREAVIYG